MIKNKKGFTLIEILAAITILGILTGIAVISVTKIIENGKEKHYLTAEENMKLAGQSFAQQNRANLPKAIGQKTKISMKKLIEKNYIQTIKDYSENDCDMDKSYVQIFKYSQSDYSYVAYLECPNYNSKENLSDITPEIDAKIDENEDARTAHARIKITGNDKIVSYSYILYRNDKQIKNTGNVQEKGLPATKNINFSLEEYTPGNIKLVVTATNVYGNTKTVTVTKDIPDRKNPTCVIKTEDQPTSPKTWIKDRNGERKITVGCEDGETGSGCKRKEYSKTFRDSMRTGKITIEDEAGNKTDCEVSVYIDKINPTITVNAFNRDASGKKVGTAVKTVSTTLDSTSKTLDLTSLSSTKWLNNTYYPNGIYYEIKINDNLELYTYKLTGNKTGLTENHSEVNAITRSINNSNVSGTAKTKNTSITTDGYNKTKVEISDAAGNTANVTMITPLDRVAPTNPTVSMYKWANNSTRPTLNNYSTLSSYQNDTWSNISIYTIATGSTDGISGFKEYQHNASGATADTTNNAGQARSVEAEGISYVQFRACDIAGNCSDYTDNKTIKIDKTAPTCEVSGGNAAWINASSSTTKRTITATCVDNGSQCDSTRAKISLNYTDDIDVTNAGAAGVGQGGTVYDNAGNSVSCAANQTVRIDKTAPDVPTVTMYKWNNNSSSSQPTSSNYSSLEKYASNTWTNKNIYTRASGGADATSGFKEYQFTTTGNTEASTNSTGTSRNVKAEGESTIKYRACDHAGNCSNYSPVQTIKIDKTNPQCNVSGGNKTWINASSNPGSRTITATCVDLTSGCTTATASLSTVYSENINTTTAGAAGNGLGGTVYDNAGNSTSCSANQTVKIDKAKPTLSSITNSKNDVWTNGGVVISATANDTGGSGIAHTKYYYSANGTRYNDWDSDSTKTSVKGTWTKERDQKVYLEITDVAGNVTSGYDAGVVKIDTTAPVISSVSNPKENTATIPGLKVTVTGADQGTYQSGLAKLKYKEGNGSWKDISNSNYSPYIDTYTALRDTTTFSYSYCDVAGNCSDAKTTKVKIVDACSKTTTTWSNSWGACSKKCGTGTQTMTGTKYSDYDGRDCGADSKSQNCNTQDCCSKTTTTWSNSWGACSKKCGTGTQTMAGTKYSDYDGSNCGADSKSQNCNTQDCCSKTTTTWSNSWGACSKDCGTGTQTMTGIKYSDYDGSNCGNDSTTQQCNTHSCTVTVNTTKYSDCNSYYITTCTSDTCNYTEKNGRPENGTISYSAAVDTMSSTCDKNFCSASLNSTDGSYTYYSISNCTISSFGVTSGNGCSKGSKRSSKSFSINVSSAPNSGKCPIWVETNEPYYISNGKIKYGNSWNTYYCGEDKFCPDPGCSRWCVSK